MESASQFSWEFEAITKYTLDIILIVDKNQIVRFATPSFKAILGFNSEDMVGTNAFDLVHPEDKERLISSHTKVVLSHEAHIDEYRVFHKDGSIRYFESRVMPVPDQPDQLIVVSIRDVTIRKNMEIEIENRKNRYQKLQNSLKNYSKDLSTVMKWTDLENRLIKEITTILPDAEPKTLIYDHADQTVDENFYPDWHSFFFKLATGKLEKVDEQVFVLIGDRKEQSCILTFQAIAIEEAMDSIWMETLVSYTIMVFESLNVIEDLMLQLETVMEKNEKPQWILRLLFNLSEKQRSELSSDLHDTVLQDQIGLYRKLQSLVNEHHFEKEIKDQLTGIIQGLMDTIHQIRTTCNELRLPLLRELGLQSALEHLFEYTQIYSTFKIVFETDKVMDLSLNEEKTIGVYRIVQELLNNASKHAQASILHFRLAESDDVLELDYLDDGKGIEADKLIPSFNSMGLSGMRERVRSFNGSIDFFSQPGMGLRVTIKIPVTN